MILHLTKFTSKFYLKSGKISRQGCLLSPLLFNTLLEVLARAIRPEKDMKSIQIGKEEVKPLTICRDSKIFSSLYRKFWRIPKKATKVINKFSKIAVYYKFKAQKNQFCI